jgi:hypothetical protein
MAVVAIYAAKNGEYGIAEEAGRWGEISGKIALVTGIMNIATNLARNYAIAQTEAVRQATEEIVKEAIQDGVVDATEEALIKAAVETAKTNVMGLAWQSVKMTFGGAWGKAVSYATMPLTMWQNNKIEDIQAETEELARKTNEAEQAAELAKDGAYTVSLDPLKYVITPPFQPLRAIENKYWTEGEYQGGRYHMGPINSNFQPIGVFKPSKVQDK